MTAARPVGKSRVWSTASESARYLRHLFQRELGESPIQCLLRKRVEYPGELLHWTDKPINEVAAGVGLENLYYFNCLFRKWTGQTPTAYRLRCQSASRRGSPKSGTVAKRGAAEFCD